MENIIIVAAIAALLIVGIVYTVKHFKGQSGCCGSSDVKVKKKKLPKVYYQKKFKIGGMHCENCKMRVEEAVNDIDGISGKVNLKLGELTVSYAHDVEDEIIRTKIERIGYTISKM